MIFSRPFLQPKNTSTQQKTYNEKPPLTPPKEANKKKHPSEANKETPP
ncbi:MAG: hypothetical protein LBC74_00595 [Planctomycetaceae bacterium]|nr:hypothetical protein [Planctomycetaceae bacterium]